MKSVNAGRLVRASWRAVAPFRSASWQAVRWAFNTALPTLCPACREAVDGDGLCASCWSKLSMIAPPYCERLGVPFTHDPGPGVLSKEAVTDPPAYRMARAAVRYDEVARALVQGLKYGDRLELAPTLGRWMARAGAEVLDEADVLVPVPLHWRRLWARRFNQSALLARAIVHARGSATGEATGLPISDLSLKRTRATAQQVGLSLKERSRNVQGAFAVDADRKAEIARRRVVLIDDVLTSGATADACARALLRAGARQVDLLVFARVVDPADDAI